MHPPPYKKREQDSHPVPFLNNSKDTIMPKNYNNNIYQTTAFDQYPPYQRAQLIEKRKYIIDLRLRSQSHSNYPQIADFLWKQSEMSAKELQQWIANNPAPQQSKQPRIQRMSKFKQFISELFQHEYA